MQEVKSRTIHYTQIPDLPSDSELYHEWITYRDAMPRFLAEGREGQIVLILGTEIVGFFTDWREARMEGCRRALGKPMMIHQIMEEEPLLLTR